MLHVTTLSGATAMPAPVSERVQKRRDALRAAGLRPIQIWVPDTRRPGFTEECRRQARLVAAADAADHDLDGFLDAVLVDLEPESEA
jgi:L-alanine-DL-glutamate epimerase-like enolase superfamily enzyme